MPAEVSLSVITGLYGSGKSYYGVSRIYLELVNTKHHVWTNVRGIRPERFASVLRDRTGSDCGAMERIHVISDDEIPNLVTITSEKGGLLVIDEAWKWFNSRDWSSAERRLVGFRDLICALRHEELEVLLMTQSFSDLDSMIRRRAQLHIKCFNLASLPVFGFVLPPILNVKEFASEENGKPKLCLSTKRYFVDPKIGSCYQTKGLAKGEGAEGGVGVESGRIQRFLLKHWFLSGVAVLILISLYRSNSEKLGISNVIKSKPGVTADAVARVEEKKIVVVGADSNGVFLEGDTYVPLGSSIGYLRLHAVSPVRGFSVWFDTSCGDIIVKNFRVAVPRATAPAGYKSSPASRVKN